MLTILHRLAKKDIVRVFSLNAVSTLVKMLTGFVSVKIVSALIGPSGIALLGQLNNFSTIFLTLSTGGINSGITKFVAEYSSAKQKVSLFLRTAVWIIATMSLSAGSILIIGASYFSELILRDRGYSSILVIFGFTLIFYSFNSLLLAVLNGYKEFRKFVIVNILSSLVGLSFSILLAFSWGIYGALLSAVTFESIVFFVTLSFAIKSPWFDKKMFIGRFSTAAITKLANFSLMAFISAATVPVSQLIIRSSILQHSSLAQAGLWEGMNRISAMYLMVITSSLSVYYLPRLSEIKTDSGLRSEILSTYKIIIPPLVFMTFVVFLLRDFIVHLLFNERFDGMQGLFPYQLVGDFFKISSWILAYQMLAKSMTKLYVATEILGSIIYVGLAMVCIPTYGIVGASLSYAGCYIIYFIILLVVFRKLLFYKYYAKQRKSAT